MVCPRCMKDDSTLVNESHYVCNDPNCVDEKGNRTQFHLVVDEKIMFPYNQIFINRSKQEFFRKPLLVLPSIKSKSKSR